MVDRIYRGAPAVNGGRKYRRHYKLFSRQTLSLSLSLSERQMQKTDGGGSLRFAFVIRFGAVAAVSRTRRETGSICIEMMVHAF